MRNIAPGGRTAQRRYAGLSASERRAGRRVRLMTAGLELFGSVGFRATTIPQLCHRAGVTARHFYEEFASREALLTQLYDDIAHTVFDRVRDAVFEYEKTPFEIVRGSIATYFEYLTSDPRRARIVAREVVGVSFELDRHRKATYDAFVEQMRPVVRGLARHCTSRTVDQALLSRALAGASDALLYEWIVAADQPSVESMIEHLTMIWLRTLQLDADQSARWARSWMTGC